MLDEQILEMYPAIARRLSYLEGLTGLKKENTILALTGIVMLYVIIAHFASISSDFIALGYPIYCSIRAQESKSREEREFWLKYWIVYSSLIFVEFFAGRLLGLIPAYYLMRTFFIIWCMAPYNENGSHFVYYKAIQPFFLDHKGKLESAISKATDEVTNLSKGVLGNEEEHGTKCD